jgi:hypothetical protein
MHLTEDNRDLSDQGDEEDRHGRLPHAPFDPASDEVVLDDSDALKLKGKNPLAEEEGQVEDDNGGD